MYQANSGFFFNTGLNTLLRIPWAGTVGKDKTFMAENKAGAGGGLN